jgi:hypothetical protein
MDSQLARIQTELTDALRRANAVAGPLPDHAWSARPAPRQWSVAECLIHLNLTSYRMDPMGRLLWVVSTISLPIGTSERFVPARGELKDSVLSEFGALQN